MKVTINNGSEKKKSQQLLLSPREDDQLLSSNQDSCLASQNVSKQISNVNSPNESVISSTAARDKAYSSRSQKPGSKIIQNSFIQQNNNNYNVQERSHKSRELQVEFSTLSGLDPKFQVLQKKIPSSVGLTKEMKQHMEKAKLIAQNLKIQGVMKEIVSNLETRRFQQLEEKHYRTLNDRAIVIKNIVARKTIRQYIKFCLDSIDNCLGSLCGSQPFHPFSLWIFWMYIIESLTIIVCLFIYTLFCFFEFFEPTFFFYLGIGSCSIFLINALLRLNTAYFDQGVVIESRPLIIKRYRNNLFFYDIIGFVGMVYQIYKNQNDQLTKQLCFLLIFKYKIYLSNMDKIEERLNLSGTMVYIMQLLKFLCTALALCHFIGTAYFFLAFCEKQYLNEQETWVDKMNYWDKSPLTQYIQSYYWALATITLIGTKGDTDLETGFCIMVLIITIGVFATILSQVAMVCEEMEKKQKNYKKDRDVLNTFFEVHAISGDLQGQLQNYLKYSYEGHKEKTVNTDFQNLMIGKFPRHLQETVKKERYFNDIQKFFLLSKNFSKFTLEQIINIVQEEYFMPNQMIIQRNTYTEPQLYLILNGEAEIYQATGNSQSVIITLKEGQFFGQDTFFTNSLPFYSVKSKNNSFTTVLTISRHKFLEIINKPGNEEDKQKFCEIKDEMTFKAYARLIRTQCYICGQLHDESKCRLINYTPNRIPLIYKFNHSVDQERSTDYPRLRPISRMSTYKSIHIIYDRYQVILHEPDMRYYIKILQDHQRNMINNLKNLTDSSFSDSDYYSDDSEASNYYRYQGATIENIQEVEEDKSFQSDDDVVHTPTNNQFGSKSKRELNFSQLMKKKKNSKQQTLNFTTSESINFEETYKLDSEDEFKLGDIYEIEKNDGLNSNRRLFTKKNIATSSIMNMSEINHINHKKNVIEKKRNNYKNIGSNHLRDSQYATHGSNNNYSSSKYNNYSKKLSKQLTLQGSGHHSGRTFQKKYDSQKSALSPTPQFNLQRKNSNQPGNHQKRNSIMQLHGKKKSFMVSPLMPGLDQVTLQIASYIAELNQGNIDFQKKILEQLNINDGDNFTIQDENEFFIDFDWIQSFAYYLPHNNSERVLAALNQKILKRIKGKQNFNSKRKRVNTIIKPNKQSTVLSKSGQKNSISSKLKSSTQASQNGTAFQHKNF